MALVHCPTCEKAFESETSRWMPFCSERCRRIDLGRWLSEDIGMPIERAESPDERYEED